MKATLGLLFLGLVAAEDFCLSHINVGHDDDRDGDDDHDDTYND